MISLTNPYVLLGGVCGAALLLAVGFGLGHHQKTLEDASAALKSARATVHQIGRQEAVSAKVGQSVEVAKAKAEAVTTSNLTKVHAYVTPKADAGCIVTVGAVRLLDANAQGVVVPDSAAGTVDQASSVGLSDIVEADTINAGHYHQLEGQVNGWISWYAAQSALAK